MDNTRLNHLEELKGSDYQIVEGTPDIQGWKIVDYTGEKVGKVRDMLFDKEARKVRYIITHLHADNDLGDRDVLIPIGKAQLDVSDERVVIPSLTVSQLSSLPSYTEGDLTPEHEYAIRNTFLGSVTTGGVIPGTMDTPYNRGTFYNNEDFDEDRFYNRRISDNTVSDLDRTDDLTDVDKTDNLTNGDILDNGNNLNETDDFTDIRNRDRTSDDPFNEDIDNPNKL